jgi:hypothetical protein
MLAVRNYSDSAKIVATYRTLDHEETSAVEAGGPANQTSEAEEKTIASEAWDFSAQQLTLPNAYWKWFSDNELLVRTDTPITKTFPRIDYSLTRHFCINIPQNAINKLIGRVNATSFLVKKNGKTYTRNAECVRFDGANIQWRHTNQGIQYAEISYKFAVNKIYDDVDSIGNKDFVTWNRLYRAEKGWWESPIPSNVAAAGSLYKLDDEITQTINGQTVSGFSLLFHPGAN